MTNRQKVGGKTTDTPCKKTSSNVNSLTADNILKTTNSMITSYKLFKKQISFTSTSFMTFYSDYTGLIARLQAQKECLAFTPKNIYLWYKLKKSIALLERALK